MRKSRWLAGYKDSVTKPVIYHCISRVVDRRFVFEERECEAFRMHDLSEFMKGLLIRFTRWFNRVHSRSGTLWEERFKSVIVESGVAARTMAAYIDFGDGAVIIR